MNIVVLTHFPSPYQLEYFNAISSTPGIDLDVIYLTCDSTGRRWTPSSPWHRALMLDKDSNSDQKSTCLIEKAELVIFNYYNHSRAIQLMNARCKLGKPWVFWGERPGFQYPRMGKWLRKWRLKCLHHSLAPIWGIGEFGVTGYRAEFGSERSYVDLPYFSDLNRFSEFSKSRQFPNKRRVILYSGSLIHRKGVDMLTNAFKSVALDHPELLLRVMGEGVLRNEMEKSLRPIASQVEFLGFRDWDQLPEVYATADVLCVPSRYDGWGLVVPEGLASGLPVIGTDRMGAALEFLNTGYNGWLIPTGDVTELAAALREAATISPEKLGAMSSSASQSVKGHTLQHGAQRFLAAAKEAVFNWQN